MSGNFTVSKAGRGDVYDITSAAIAFYQESDFAGKLPPNPDKYKGLLYEFIDNPYVASFVARDNESQDLLGYIHIYCQNDYTDDLVGEMFQFYVSPKARATGVSRALVDAAVAQYKQWGCKRAYAEASPGFADDGKNIRLFVNLWKKSGYTEKGIVMMKEF